MINIISGAQNVLLAAWLPQPLSGKALRARANTFGPDPGLTLESDAGKMAWRADTWGEPAACRRCKGLDGSV